ncbi:MAG: SusC/RagA family TonB-linked outer membrane protein [Chitinophagaceae bacterium]|nr:SusC/RagA family TonB-linked outer membrane protein [Chitinophagaceae bacterium]
MLKPIFTTFLVLFMSTALFAQINVRGKVVSSEDNRPVASVTVNVKGTSQAVTTDASGNYTINNVPGNALLVFTSVGFHEMEVNVNNRQQVDVKLTPEAKTLDEVMVVAFGTAKKSTYTGSAAVIGEENFSLRPVTEVGQALTGTTPGLQVGTSNGMPGSAPTIRIRGLGSFNAGNDPLIVLDGMPYDNALTSINPNDIESITVLKDASSAALYGARAANGVLLINTKKGKSGAAKINAKYNMGFVSRQSADFEKLGERDYMELYWESQRNAFLFNGMSEALANTNAGPALLSGMGYNPYLMDPAQLFDANGKLNPNAVNHWAEDEDWYGAITRTGKRQDADISISGGNNNSDYYTSLGYLNEEGFIVGSKYSRITGKVNANSKVNSWMKAGVNFNMSYANADGQQNESSGNNSNPFRATRYMGNIFPIHLHNPLTGAYILDANGQKMPDFGSGWSDPGGAFDISSRDAFPATNHPYESRHIYNGFIRQTLNLKAYTDISFTKELKATINGGLGSNMYRSWNGGYVYEQKGNAGSSARNISNTTTWTFQQLLNYAKRFGDHSIDVLAGHESYQYQYHYMSTSMKTQSILGDNFEYANFTEINALPNSYTNNYRVEGYLSRINYDYDRKYFASVSFRKDGSSRFYKDVRWGNFWSVGAGWSLDREHFMENIHFVNALKLRASYGEVGNDDLPGYYPWRATYTTADNGEPGYVQSSLGNKLLTWETSRNFDIATEFTLLNNRLSGSIEYFHRVSSNLLFSVPQPISSGIETIDVNAGSMYNKGVEIALDGEVYRDKDWRVRLNGNATFLKNKITELPLDPYVSSVYKIEPGHSRYEFYVRQWAGVNPDDGYNLYKADVENFTFGTGELINIKGVDYTENIEKSLYAYSGSAMPTVNGGFGANVGWKDFNLKFNFYYQLGGKFYDAGYSSFMTGSLLYFAQHKDLLKRWKKPGDVTDIPKVTAGSDRTNIEAATSSRWLVTSNMIELTNINLSYRVPKKFLQGKNISDATIYFAADNAFLKTARRGLYPRRNFSSGYLANTDVYPPSMVVSFGLSITL